MSTLTDKTRAFYLLLLIFFLLAIGFFVFDYYKLIDADEMLPFLAKKPATVNWDQESPTEVEKLEIEKAKERLQEEMAEIEKIRAELQLQKEKLESDTQNLEEVRKGIKEKERQIIARQKEEENRQNKLKVLANKVGNMRPMDAVGMLENWPDQDIIDVFKQMDKDAEEEGKPTITNYLLSLFEAKRRSVIANKWLDSEADKVPDESGRAEDQAIQ
ncbi:MAG: flagellar protein FlbB [Spirochaetia bacterium]|nr:flagellar protein FlbB [Spirochaetia bacterium]